MSRERRKDINVNVKAPEKQDITSFITLPDPQNQFEIDKRPHTLKCDRLLFLSRAQDMQISEYQEVSGIHCPQLSAWKDRYLFSCSE